MTSSHETVKHAVDAISIAAVAGALMDWLPPIAALMTIIWTAIRIWETDTMTRFVGRNKRTTNDE